MLVVLTFNSQAFYGKVSFNDLSCKSKAEAVEKWKDAKMTLDGRSLNSRPVAVRVYGK